MPDFDVSRISPWLLRIELDRKKMTGWYINFITNINQAVTEVNRFLNTNKYDCLICFVSKVKICINFMFVFENP